MRSRIIKAEKTSYWRQYEQGMLSRESVRVLINLSDTVLDTPDRYDIYDYHYPCYLSVFID